MKGAPLVPPNQRVNITVQQSIPGEATVKYGVQVSNPSQGTPQIFLEQGLAFGFSYLHFPPDKLEKLALGLGIDLDALCGGASKCFSDVGRRNIFHELYLKMRYFDDVVDGMTEKNVGQVPGSVDAAGKLSVVVDPSLEGL